MLNCGLGDSRRIVQFGNPIRRVQSVQTNNGICAMRTRFKIPGITVLLRTKFASMYAFLFLIIFLLHILSVISVSDR